MKPKQLYFTLLAFSIVIAAAILAMFFFGQRQIETRVTVIEKLSADVEIQENRLKELKKLEAEYQELLPLINKVKNVLPEQKQQAEIIAQIAKLATQSNLKVNDLSFQATSGLPGPITQTENVAVGGIKTMPVTFEIDGSFEQLQSLLQKFEKQERFMQVRSLSISRGEGGNLAVGVQLVVFLKP